MDGRLSTRLPQFQVEDITIFMNRAAVVIGFGNFKRERAIADRAECEFWRKTA